METNCRYHEQHENRLKRLELSSDETAESLKSVTKIEVILEQMQKQLDAIENEIKENHSCTNIRLTKMDQRISAIENKPGEVALSYWKFIFSGLLTGILGYLLRVFLG